MFSWRTVLETLIGIAILLLIGAILNIPFIRAILLILALVAACIGCGVMVIRSLGNADDDFPKRIIKAFLWFWLTVSLSGFSFFYFIPKVWSRLFH